MTPQTINSRINAEMLLDINSNTQIIIKGGIKMGNNSRSRFWTFHNQATATGDGFELGVGANDVTMNVDISGTASAATLVFEGLSNDDGNWRSIMCVNLSTYDMATSTSMIGSLWQFSLEGLVKVRVRLSAVSGGYITVKSTVVN